MAELGDECPELYADDGTEKIAYKEFFDGLIRYLCENKQSVKKRIFRVLKARKKVNGDFTDDDYLRFVPINYRGERVTLLLTSDDIYVIGFRVKEKYYVISEDVNFNTAHMISVQNCLNKHHKLGIKVLKVAHSYEALETLADVKRGQILVGKKPLLDALDYLVTTAEIVECESLGRHILVFTQMISEAVRIKILADLIEEIFNEGGLIPEHILFVEHAWSTASKILLGGSEHDVIELYYIELSNDSRLTYTELGTIYGALKNYEASMLNGKIDEFDQIITSKYLHACYGKQIRKLELFNLGTKYQVTAAVHIHKRNLMLQYNYDSSLCNVGVSVDAPELIFTESDFQPITSFFPCKIFVAFDQIGDFSSATFSTTLCGKHDTMDVEESLKDFIVAARDYIRGTGCCAFMAIWEKHAKFEKLSRRKLPQKLTVEEAKRAVIELFNLQDVTGQASRRQKGPKKPTLYYGKYMNTHEVLVKATFELENRSVDKIDICARCSDEKSFAVIERIILDWEKSLVT